jgi:hypothetical protein
MSAAWGATGVPAIQEEAQAKRMIRLWGMLAVAGSFLLYVYSHLNMRLF